MSYYTHLLRRHLVELRLVEWRIMLHAWIPGEKGSYILDLLYTMRLTESLLTIYRINNVS